MSATIEHRLLHGLKAVDLGVGMAAALAARMLADMGVSVTRIEPGAGDPFYSAYPAYAVWREGFEQVGEDDLRNRLADADICIIGGEDHPDCPRRRDALALSAAYPGLVLLDITDGPQATDYVGPSTELLAQVRSGLVWEQEPDRPIVNAFNPASYGAAFQGLIGLLGALIERERSGKGQIVTTSLFEGALAWIGTHWAQLENPTPAADYVIPRGVYPLIFRTRDKKFIHLAIGGAGSKYGFYQILDIDDPSVQPDDSGMPKPGGSRKDFFGDFDLLSAHVAKQDQAPLLARAWERGLPAEPVLEPGECWSEPQIARNGVIVGTASGGSRVGLSFRAEILRTGGQIPARAPAERPLDGFVVVDLGAFVAGPLAAVALADLGADVIKVEAKQGDPNRSIFKSFAASNRGKRVIGIDMKAPEGLAIVCDLARRADLVLNNFRPGVSARLGVDPERLADLNPELVVMEAPAFGRDGPLAHKAGFDMVMQAWTGHEHKAAGAGNSPRWNRTNLVDIAAAMSGTIAMLAALLRRERSGDTVSLELPLCNAGIATIAELVRTSSGTFTGVPQMAADLSGYHPAEALYQARDGWLVLVARGAAAIEALRDKLELREQLAVDPSGWGQAEAEAIAARIGAMTVAEAVMRSNDALWIEAAPDDREQKILNDPALRARGTVRATEHAKFGRVIGLGTLFRLSRSALGNDRPAPVAGEHTDNVLAELSHDPDRIQALRASGVVV